jgi:hypothetical protein
MATLERLDRAGRVRVLLEMMGTGAFAGGIKLIARSRARWFGCGRSDDAFHPKGGSVSKREARSRVVHNSCG